MVTGWKLVNNVWYYMGPSGDMFTGCTLLPPGSLGPLVLLPPGPPGPPLFVLFVFLLLVNKYNLVIDNANWNGDGEATWSVAEDAKRYEVRLYRGYW